MTQQSQSQINTWLVSMLTGICGFIAFQVFVMNGQMAEQRANVAYHTAQLDKLTAKVDRLADDITTIKHIQIP